MLGADSKTRNMKVTFIVAFAVVLFVWVIVSINDRSLQTAEPLLILSDSQGNVLAKLIYSDQYRTTVRGTIVDDIEFFVAAGVDVSTVMKDSDGNDMIDSDGNPVPQF